MQLIYGSKAGQKKPHTPRISDDTVASITKITALYLLGEGEVRGLVNGSKSIYFEDTPLEDEDGHRNFENVEWEIRHGTVDQTHIPGVPSASTERVINTELRSSVPWTRLITDIELSSINVNVSWPRLSKMEDNGDVNGVIIDYAIDVRTDGGAWVTMVSKSLTAKTSGRYQRTHNIPLPDADNNWQVRVRKITEDGDNERLFNQMHIDSIAEIVDAKLCYPHSAVIKLTWDSRAFGNTPKVSFETYGRYVKVPVNYNAETRTSTGIWNGEFKEAYTTNPAWIYYDLITNDRYGLGNKLKPYMIHKWAIEHIAKICDVMVDDGKGGLEPRYTCNLYLQTAETAFDVLQHIAGIFRGMAFWNGSQIILDADTYKDCDYVITRANVVNGEFVKTGTAANERHTIAKVGYSNPDNNYEVDYVFVRNERAIAEIGINILDLSAIACTSEGEAYRFGLAALLTEQNRTQTVSFTMGLDGALPSVGDRIDIPDIMFTGHNTGGRISGVNKNRTVITVDRDNVPVAPGDKLVVNLESGKAQTREILSINGREITVSKPFDAVSRENVWAVSSDELPTMSFIVLSVRANEDGTQYSYTALQYDATLQQQIDNGTIIENKPPLPPLASMIIDAPQSITLSTRHRIEQAQTITTLVITWEQVKDAVAYDVEWRKDDGDWISVPRTGNISVEVDGVYSGNYIARVRAVSAFDAVSKPITSTLTKVEGKAGKPPSLLSLKATGALFGMELTWSFAPGSGDAAYTEIQVASAPDTNMALLGQYSYPTNNAKLNGLQNGLVQYYRGRIVDKLGFKSDWSGWVKGEVLNDSSQVLDLIEGQITESHLYKTLTDKINLVDKIAPIDQRITKEVQDRIKALGEIKDGYDQKFISVDNSITDAQGTADAKGEVIFSSTAPIAAKQLKQNLWIDTANNANTPKRWDGKAWVEVTDKAAKDAAGVASAAQSAADAAQGAANEADRKAKVALGELKDISDDDKLTPAEKKQLLLIVDDIKQVDTDIRTRASKYNVSVTEYDAAYTALVTNYINDLLANLNTTSSIDRSAFNEKFNTFFTKRAQLDTSIAIAAKSVADKAASAANAAQGTADAAKGAAAEAQVQADAAGAAASAAQNAANEADRKAKIAQGQVDDISADGKLTPVEKKQTKLIVDDIKQVDADIKARAAKYGVSTTEYDKAYKALVTDYIDALLASLNTTSNITRSEFNGKFNALFAKRAELDTAITVAAKKVADDAQQAASAAQGAAEDASRAAGAAAGAAKVAKDAADEADRKARVAQGQVNDISADGKLTPVEKKQANLIWSEIAKTDTEVRANATKYKVGITAYSKAYSALDTYLKSLITGAAANTTSDIDRAAFDKAFADIYAARAEVNKLIVAAAEKQAADAQSKADEAAGTADKAAEDIIAVEGTVSALKKSVEGNTGLIVEEKEIRIQRDAVVTQKLDYLSSEIDMGYADKTKYADKNRSIQWTLATAISAENYTQNQKIENLQSEFNNNSAQIQKELLTLASDDLALASEQSRLSARVGQNSSDILSLSLAVQTPGTGLAAQVTHLQSATEAAERLAGTKGEIIYSVAEPPAKDRLPQNLWFKKEGDNTTPHVWDVVQSKWVALTDKAAADAKVEAEAAKQAAGTAKEAADAKGENIYSPTVPSADKQLPQNIWYKVEGNVVTAHAWANGKWTPIVDKGAADAKTAADGKGEALYSTTEPAAPKRLTQNVWYKIEGSTVTAHRWNGAEWKPLVDTLADKAQRTADGKGEVIYSATEPSADKRAATNVWYKPENGTVTAYVWSNGAWTQLVDRLATQANKAVADISDDNKLTPVEKQQTALIVDDINKADTDIKARAKQYNVSTSNYSLAYDALIKYINPLLLNKKVTSDIVRTDFTRYFSDLYAARAQLDIDIGIAVKLLADNKGEVIYSSTAPAADKSKTQNLWVDTTNGKNVFKHWNGSAWVVATDQTAVDLAKNKGEVIYSATQPSADKQLPQNIWYKHQTVNSQAVVTPHVWSGGKWTPLTDKGVVDAVDIANSKGEVITSDTIPDATKRKSQNLWIDTRQGKNTPRRWNGSVWEAVTDQAAIDAAKDIKLNLATYVKESGAYSTEFGNISGEITTMQSTVKGVADGIQVVAAIGDAERLKHEISKERLNKNKAALQGKVTDLDSLIAKYKAQRTDAQAKKAQATDASVIAAYDSQIALLNTTITDAETQRSEVASQVTQLDQEIKELASLKLTESNIKKQYFVKFDSGNRAAGFGIMENANATIDFAVLADKFYIASPSGTGKGVRPFAVYTSPTTINGVTVPAGTYLQSATIMEGSIDIAKINKASINSLSALSANIGHFKSAETGARLEIRDSVLEVYDSNNRLRVRMGVW